MINLQLTQQEFDAIMASLEEFFDNEYSWLNKCVENKEFENNEDIINASVNIRTTEILLKRFGAMQKVLSDSENKQ